MYSALALLAAALAIATCRPAKTGAVAIVIAALGAAIVLPWLHLGEPRYVWLANVNFVVTGRGDAVARLAIGLVGSVAAIVALYAYGDPETDDASARFFSVYAIFVAAMFAFVDASTVLFAYACWEVMGVASFVLIGHLAHEADAGKSARRALTATRVGDLAVLLGAALLASGRNEFGALALVVGAAIKAGQLGSSPWLVGAMVAPTPVSALLHSATLVAAGPFLIARFVPLAAFPHLAAGLLAYATISALVAAVFAATSDDAKRTLAWSSIEQLAQAFVATALGAPLVAYAVLAGHAIAKPALFFAAGMQRIATGSSRFDTAARAARRIPALVVAVGYGGIALVGIPPLLSASALARTWSDANAARPGMLAIGVALASLAGWYVARFALRLMPTVERPFARERIGRGASIAVFVLVVAGFALSVNGPRLGLGLGSDSSALPSLVLPIAAACGALACFALRTQALVAFGPVVRDGVARWDAAFARPVAALAHFIEMTDRALEGAADRVAEIATVAGRRTAATDVGLDRAGDIGARAIVIAGRRAGALLDGNVSRYVGASAIVLFAASIVALALAGLGLRR